jgi:hypothetical protein
LFGKLFNYILRKKGCEEIQMGDYNIKPESDGKYRITPEVRRMWLKQLLAWISIVTLVLFIAILNPYRVSCAS